MKHAMAYPWDPPDDVVVFETPEQTQVEYPLASFGTRLVGGVIDAGVALGITLFLAVSAGLVAIAVGLWTGSTAGAQFAAAFGAGYFMIHSLYKIWGEVRGEGQSFGKRVVGTRVVLSTGQGLSLGPALIRGLALLVDWFPLFWLVPTLGSGCRRTGDLLAGTYVVRVGKRSGPARTIDWPAETYTALEERMFHLGEEVAGRLHPQDLNLIEYLLDRVQAAPPPRRKRLLQAVAKRYIERLEMEEHREQVLGDPRRFFHELGLFLKGRFEERAY